MTINTVRMSPAQQTLLVQKTNQTQNKQKIAFGALPIQGLKKVMPENAFNKFLSDLENGAKIGMVEDAATRINEILSDSGNFKLIKHVASQLKKVIPDTKVASLTVEKNHIVIKPGKNQRGLKVKFEEIFDDFFNKEILPRKLEKKNSPIGNLAQIVHIRRAHVFKERDLYQELKKKPEIAELEKNLPDFVKNEPGFTYTILGRYPISEKTESLWFFKAGYDIKNRITSTQKAVNNFVTKIEEMFFPRLILPKN